MVLKAMWKTVPKSDLFEKIVQLIYMKGLCTHHSQKRWPVMVVWVLQKYLLNNFVESRKNYNLIKWNKIT